LNKAGMIIYLNGEFLPLAKACISPLDRGFLFGDGVYEVIPAYNNTLFRINEHLDRLQNSLDAIRLKNPHSTEQWIDILSQLIGHQAQRNHSIYLQVTRGADTKRDHSIPPSPVPTVFIMSTPLLVEPADTEPGGVCVITQPDIRWEYCNIKATTLLANILQRQTAIDNNCAETLLVRNGLVMEGAASNVFIVTNETIQTPPKSSLLLPGITRDLVLEIASQGGLPTSESDITVEDLFNADEVWITSSTKEVLPVTRIDDRVVGTGKPGPVWKEVTGLYQDYKKQLISGSTQ